MSERPAGRPATVVYVGTSVDGFIARKDHTLDFLDSAGDADTDMGWEEFRATIDALVFGRHTYEFLEREVEEWPYGDLPVVVLTTRDLALPDMVPDSVRVMNATPAEVLAALHGEGRERVYVDGGTTVQQFLRDGLIDEIILTKIPVLIGNGIPIFGDLDADVALELLRNETFSNGAVQQHYRVRR